MSLKALLNTCQQKVAKNSLLVKIAVKVRNQSNRIIAYSFSQTHLSDKNGEQLLLEKNSEELNVVFDVGANKGEWTESLMGLNKRSNTRYYLFEPGTAALLRLNNLFGKNSQCIITPIGLGDKNTLIPFYELEDAGEQSSFIKTDGCFKSATLLQVSTVDLFCEENFIPSIDFLKIDVEGFDFKVLLGCEKMLSKGAIRFIQFEYGANWRKAGSTLVAAIDWLEKFGYNVQVITKTGLKKFDVDFYGEYFGYSNFFASKIL